MIALLLALLFADPANPVIDEGDRWECASAIGTFDSTGPKQARLVFWRRNSCGQLIPGAELGWECVTLWNAEPDGIRFHWHDGGDECFRTLLVPRVDWVVADLDKCRVSWPSCPWNFRGFLPNPEKRDPE